MYHYTKHAVERNNERCGEELPPINIILKNGYRAEDFGRQSSMRKYLKKHQQKVGDVAVVYKNRIFIIRDNVVVTIFDVPEKYYCAGYLLWDDK